MKRWIMIAGVIGVVAVLVSAAAMFRSGTPVQTARVARDTIRQFIDERGKTRLPREYRIATAQAGWVQEITLVEGTRVKKDQIVAQMSGSDLDDAVAEARAVVERLDAAIAENDDVRVESSLAIQAKQFVESMDATVQAAKARVDSSQKRFEFAETNAGRVRTLQQSGARTDDDLDRANLAYWEGQLGYRQDQLVWESLKSVRAATALLPKMVADYIAHKSLTRAVLEKQHAEAAARLRRVETQRQRGIMRSPVDGIILKRLVQNAQELPAGTELLRIGNLDQLEVEADILSQDVVRVQRGDPVEIYGPAVAAELGHGVAGSVQRIYPAGFTKISSLGVEQQRVKVVVQFAPSARERVRELGTGVDFRVRVRIFTAQRDDTLVVPRSALFRSATGKWQLFVVRDRHARIQTVEIGLINDWRVEITAGLRDGDLAILAPDSKLQPGDLVSPTTQ